MGGFCYLLSSLQVYKDSKFEILLFRESGELKLEAAEPTFRAKSRDNNDVTSCLGKKTRPLTTTTSTCFETVSLFVEYLVFL